MASLLNIVDREPNRTCGIFEFGRPVPQIACNTVHTPGDSGFVRRLRLMTGTSALAATVLAASGCGGGGDGDGTNSGTSSSSGAPTAGETTTATADGQDGVADDTAGESTGPGSEDSCAVGEAVFDDSVVHELSLQLSDADWAAMIVEAEQSPEYGGPDKTYFNADLLFDGVALTSPVAARLKGHSSLLFSAAESHAFPLKLDFDRVNEAQTLDGLSKLNVHTNLDGITAVNEYLSYGAIRAHGVPTARLSFARVTVNGEVLGLYTLVEHMQGKFFRCHYDEPHGDLYKPEEPIGNLEWQGPNISDYEPEIQFKWPSESVTSHASLLNLLTVINNDGVEAFDPVLNITEVLTYLALNAGLGNYDYYASFGHNYYLYESTAGRFTMLPWDMNFSQGPLSSPCGYGRNTEQWPISNKLLADPGYVQEYVGILESFLTGAGSQASLEQRLDDVLPLLGRDINAGAVEELRGAIALRVDSQLQAISAGVKTCPEFADGEGRDPCDTCIDKSCAPQLDACLADPDCECVLACVAGAEEEAVCLMTCGLAATPTTFDDLIACIVGPCGTACE